MIEAVQEPLDRAKAEVDAYRGGSDQPVGGYVAVMAVFSAIVATAGLVAARTGRRLPERLGAYDLLLIAAGTHKLARTISKDAVTSPLRAPFTTFAGPGGPAELMEEVRGSGVRHSVGELLTCPFCLDVWIATGFVIGQVFAPRATRLVAATFTAITGADFLQLWYARAQSAASG